MSIGIYSYHIEHVIYAESNIIYVNISTGNCLCNILCL
jgi:hypothetical protein